LSSCPDLLDQLKSEEHVVQLYGSDDRLLTANVARYLAEGLRRGDGLLVIGIPEHRSSITRRLRDEPGYSRAVLEGRLVFLDAEMTLTRFMRGGAPDPELFHAVVAGALQRVADSAAANGVRAYGEMVGLLWKSGARAAAVRLEELWNNLLRKSDVSLFCAYPIDIFGPEFDAETLDPLLCSHTHLIPHDLELEQALSQATADVVGSGSAGNLFPSNDRPGWGKLPPAEAMVLWIRKHLPESAEQILARAKQHYQPRLA
jgi:DcmR-like sensory protein